MLKSVSRTRTEPSIEPILLEELKEQLRIDSGDLDPELQHLITEARQWVEDNELWLCLISQTVVEKFSTLADSLQLYWGPVQSITSVAYIDTDGVSQTLSTDTYELGKRLGVSYCRLKYNQTWPSVRGHEDAVTLTYVAGYGDDRHDVPLAIRQAVKLYAAYRFDGSADCNMLNAARLLLGPHSAKR